MLLACRRFGNFFTPRRCEMLLQYVHSQLHNSYRDEGCVEYLVQELHVANNIWPKFLVGWLGEEWAICVNLWIACPSLVRVSSSFCLLYVYFWALLCTPRFGLPARILPLVYFLLHVILSVRLSPSTALTSSPQVGMKLRRNQLQNHPLLMYHLGRAPNRLEFSHSPVCFCFSFVGSSSNILAKSTGSSTSGTSVSLESAFHLLLLLSVRLHTDVGSRGWIFIFVLHPFECSNSDNIASLFCSSTPYCWSTSFKPACLFTAIYKWVPWLCSSHVVIFFLLLILFLSYF